MLWVDHAFTSFEYYDTTNWDFMAFALGKKLWNYVSYWKRPYDFISRKKNITHSLNRIISINSRFRLEYSYHCAQPLLWYLSFCLQSILYLQQRVACMPTVLVARRVKLCGPPIRQQRGRWIATWTETTNPHNAIRSPRNATASRRWAAERSRAPRPPRERLFMTAVSHLRRLHQVSVDLHSKWNVCLGYRDWVSGADILPSRVGWVTLNRYAFSYLVH